MNNIKVLLFLFHFAVTITISIVCYLITIIAAFTIETVIQIHLFISNVFLSVESFYYKYISLCCSLAHVSINNIFKDTIQ